MNVVIFAGGVGTRLWPLSRKKYPKQFEKIVGEQSTLQLAASRLQPDFPWNKLFVSTSASYVDIVHKQLKDLPKNHVIGEPMMRDVGPAVGLVSSILMREAPEEPMIILWSDHLVKQDKLFRKILTAAGSFIKQNPNKIVFVSQKPRFASENLGWIQYGDVVNELDSIRFHSFVDFQYRPDKSTAEKYYRSGHHAWNLGYFVTTPSFLMEQFARYAPNIYEGVQRISAAWKTHKFKEVLDEVYPTLEKISFDNAVLEKLNPSDAFVISDNLEWSDVGAWESLKEALQDSENGNVTSGKVMLKDSTDSLVYNYTKQLVVTIDASELLVINTDDVVLVCHKNSVPKIKKLVESMANTEHDHLI